MFVEYLYKGEKMSQEFEIKTIDSDHGPAVSIVQKEGIGYNFFTGEPMFNPIILTPYEAEQLIKELTQAANQARNQSQYLRKK